MGLFLSLLRNPFFLLCGLVVSALWYYYYRLVATLRQLKKAQTQLDQARNEQIFLLSDFEKWAEEHRPEYPIEEYRTIRNPEVSQRLLDRIMKEMQKNEDSALGAWHDSIHSSIVDLEQKDSDYSPILTDYENMLNAFPTNFLAGLLNLPPAETFKGV